MKQVRQHLWLKELLWLVSLGNGLGAVQKTANKAGCYPVFINQ